MGNLLSLSSLRGCLICKSPCTLSRVPARVKSVVAVADRLRAASWELLSSQIYCRRIPPWPAWRQLTLEKSTSIRPAYVFMLSHHGAAGTKVVSRSDPIFLIALLSAILWVKPVCFLGCLALPKLNLQFLTLHDYLLRNFNLFRLESTYEIRQDIEDVVCRMKPW